MDEEGFRPVRFAGLRARLEEVKHLLDQAAVVSLAQGRDRLEDMVKHAQQRGGRDGDGNRRRYR